MLNPLNWIQDQHDVVLINSEFLRLCNFANMPLAGDWSRGRYQILKH